MEVCGLSHRFVTPVAGIPMREHHHAIALWSRRGFPNRRRARVYHYRQHVHRAAILKNNAGIHVKDMMLALQEERAFC